MSLRIFTLGRRGVLAAFVDAHLQRIRVFHLLSVRTICRAPASGRGNWSPGWRPPICGGRDWVCISLMRAFLCALTNGWSVAWKAAVVPRFGHVVSASYGEGRLWLCPWGVSMGTRGSDTVALMLSAFGRFRPDGGYLAEIWGKGVVNPFIRVAPVLSYKCTCRLWRPSLIESLAA